jgi:hypothetical protein
MTAGPHDRAERGGRTDEETHLAALLAVLALARGDAETSTGGAGATSTASRTGGEALARWRTRRLAVLQRSARGA